MVVFTAFLVTVVIPKKLSIDIEEDDLRNSTSDKPGIFTPTPEDATNATETIRFPSLLIDITSPQTSIKSSIKFYNKSLPKKRKAEAVSSLPIGEDSVAWKCPNITTSRSLECGCDLPYTLRCNGDLHGLSVSYLWVKSSNILMAGLSFKRYSRKVFELHHIQYLYSTAP